jgi:predicted ATPase
VAVTASSSFGSLLNALYRERLSEVINLTPLPEDAVAQIIDHTLGAETAPTVVQSVSVIAEGNPFFVQEITRAALKSDRLELRNGKWHIRRGASLGVPSGLRDVLRERVQRLGPAVEFALTATAVAGREFHFVVLQGVTGLPDGELLDALDSALSSHLIEETQAGYRFR